MATILYVEDHPPAQMLMRAIIEEMTDHRLLVAGSGVEAAMLVTHTRPDLLIVDLDLPDTDGMTLAAALRQQHSVPVLLVSAYAETVEENALGEHITAYLAKPLDPDHVAEIIRNTLARSV
jgi:CheY-like chemotaxis protein